MAKITISRLFEVSAYLQTEAGSQLKDALTYLSEFVEVTVRALRNGLTFQDNFAATLRNVSLVSGTETVVLPNTEKRRVTMIMVRQVIDDTNYIVSGFGWRYNAAGDVVVTADFKGTPLSPVSVQLAILF